MTDQEDGDREKREMRGMMIFAVAAVLLILGIMGANVLWHKDTTTPTDISSQSRTSPAQQ